MAFLVCLLAPSAEARPWTNIRIASEGARPPYNFLDANNELSGFEIDLGRELCKRMKVTCAFVMQDWDGMIPGLLSGHFDAIMAAMEITDERRDRIDFTKPYVKMPSAFMAAKDQKIHDSTSDGLADRKIGVEAGGPHQAYLEEFYKQSKIETYATLEDAVLDLANNRIDAVLGDKDAIMDFLKTRKEAQCCKYLADVPRDPAYFGEGIGIGLRREDHELKSLFEKALDEVKADGTFETIRARYFDFEID